MNRVVVHVDGFNLYYSLRSKGWRRYDWLNLCRLSRNLLRAGQRLVMVRYFTAGVAPKPCYPEKPVRQNTPFKIPLRIGSGYRTTPCSGSSRISAAGLNESLSLADLRGCDLVNYRWKS